jgi:hypothetical protein
LEWQEAEPVGYVKVGPANRLSQEHQSEKSEFEQAVEEAVSFLQDEAANLVEENRLAVMELDKPRSDVKVLADTIEYVESGLVERDIEARLVVLGMVSKEHVLFIGPPGTSSKSPVF